MDVLIAVTNDQATNVLVGTLAKNYEIKRILVRVRDPSYIEVCKKIGIEEIIEPAVISAQYIMAHLRGLELVNTIEKIIKVADVITTNITKESKYHHKRISEIIFPRGSHIIAIIRENEIKIPETNLKLREHDKIVLIHKKTLKESLTKFFKRNKS